mmetsp:Transcript_41254/g.87781  ORF Transcript_41254/g.87781 Transcript_41254/m.87781 type:complete len:221 (-) Transcript_41254:94-756(-)
METESLLPMPGIMVDTPHTGSAGVARSLQCGSTLQDELVVQSWWRPASMKLLALALAERVSSMWYSSAKWPELTGATSLLKKRWRRSFFCGVVISTGRHTSPSSSTIRRLCSSISFSKTCFSLSSARPPASCASLPSRRHSSSSSNRLKVSLSFVSSALTSPRGLASSLLYTPLPVRPSAPGFTLVASAPLGWDISPIFPADTDPSNESSSRFAKYLRSV